MMGMTGTTELERVEAELAKRLGIQGSPRDELIRLAKANQLIEDELVSEWHALYAWYSEFGD
jgi:hypothetical protein